MKRMMTAIGVAVVIAGAVATVSAQGAVSAPFGIRMGAAKSELTIAAEPNPWMVKLASVPRPHPDMETYIVQVTPKAGVCFVKAVGKTLTTNADGADMRTVFNDLKTQLEGVYGPGQVHDRLSPGSIWNEPRDYMMGMVKGERTLMVVWSGQLGPGLERVGLIMKGLSRESAYAVVEYYFTNYESCEAEAKALKATP
jgi:hypothetical protein